MNGTWQLRPRKIIKNLVEHNSRFIMQLPLDGLIGLSKTTESTGILNGTLETIISNWVIQLTGIFMTS
ncbi:hypothetical protein OIU74_004646 [Salix koriyanagi]|uniref:Uncharacterized protein n=1 Tax=Salix koriyanagi TaxID=2511006 RepID=A0A9Q0UMM2_9ROSI|nr:hypothetical protein OIU74_004646 [Salix koriyanagi]